MKKHILNISKSWYIRLIMIVCMTMQVGIASAQRTVQLSEALSVAKMGFTTQPNTDYYLCVDSTERWTFFADPTPLKGWEHDCYIVYVPKVLNQGQLLFYQKVGRRLPPGGNLTALEVHDYYGNQATIKPAVASANLSNQEISIANKTYAIILSGGVNKNSNYERYWNDCSFVYQTLVKKYGIPKNHINVLMSDGTNPGQDMKTTTGQYITSPLDLDFDGYPDISQAATRSNIINTLNGLVSTVKKDEHLFIYVIDHGGTTDGVNSSYINLWGSERLYDTELASMLNPFTIKFVNVNVVLGQCFSGGFIDNLTRVGCVVATASSGSESSYACSDKPYDEFVYHWTSAINQALPTGAPVVSDYDNNGRVTMHEAFTYARDNDRWDIETPQYVSTPTSIGEDLAFDNLPLPIDLYIRDNIEDTGKEPNLTTDKFWKSPDIWIRNSADMIEQHENPYYSPDHLGAVIYVRVHNRGKEAYNGGQYLHVYWARASSGFKVGTWKGYELYNNQDVAGGVINPVSIPPMGPGESRIVQVNWAMPNISIYDYDNDHHYCITTNIAESHLPNYSVPNPDYGFDTDGDNDIAQKNLTILVRSDATKEATVFVRNIYNSNTNYSLELVPESDEDLELFDLAQVNMILSTPIYNAWVRGGQQSTGINYNAQTNHLKLGFTSPTSKVYNVNMNASEFEKVSLSFDFHTGSIGLRTYTYDLIQRDQNGKIIGGETFQIEAPLNHIVFPPIINPLDLDNGDVELQSNLDETENTIKWSDNYGTEISNSSSVIVTPTAQNKVFSVTVHTNDGYIATESIELEVTNGIKSIAPTMSVENYIDVELYHETTSTNSHIIVSSATNNTTALNTVIPVGTKNITIDTSSLSDGIYILSYVVDGVIIESKRFNK